MKEMIKERIMALREWQELQFIRADRDPRQDIRADRDPRQVDIRQDLVIYDVKNPDMPDVSDINISDFFYLIDSEFNIVTPPEKREKLITLEDLINHISNELECAFAWCTRRFYKEDTYLDRNEADDDYDDFCNIDDDDYSCYVDDDYFDD